LKGAPTNGIPAFETSLSFESLNNTGFSVTIDGHISHVVALIDGNEVYVRTERGRFVLTRRDPFHVARDKPATDDRIIAPLPGTVVAVFAAEGEWLEKGAPIATLEVMKMEHVLRAPFAGVIKGLACKVGDVIPEGAQLAQVEAKPQK
jgi:3-methylcrotonyl-CoA carboxylase alpha subunit